MYMHKESLLTEAPPVAIPDVARPSFSDNPPPNGDRWHIIKTFRASCELWMIVKDWLPLYYNGNGEPGDLDTESLMGVVTRIYHRLEAWKGSLPEELENSQDALPHVLILQ